ncbi:MAG TPA: NADH-quinone oxidoreductase subunit N, partial [Deltaproteobacteria bacterium]|nr:NADH-quinone oxidoreductase subunit N [Deltaproteobacteria bacterium]
YKYFIYGATTSAVSLYGMTILYGLAGTTSIPAIAAALGAAPSTLALAAVVLAITGVLFKLAVFPFHFWAPDVYQVSTHGAAAFIAATSKVGAVAALLRLLLVGADVEQLYWVLGGLAVLSMTFGNLAAIAQKDLKRLLAYSGVAQGGYILLGLMGQDSAGYTAATYYTIGYLAMVLLCFLVIVEVGRTLPESEGGRPSNVLPISALDGLHQRSPVLALALLVGLLGMAGVPPTAGFTGKWLLFKAAIEVEAFWLVLIAGINNTIAIYYYLIVVKAAYVHGAEGQPRLEPGLMAKMAGVGVSLAVVFLGVFPQWVVPALDRAMNALLGG